MVFTRSSRPSCQRPLRRAAGSALRRSLCTGGWSTFHTQGERCRGEVNTHTHTHIDTHMLYSRVCRRVSLRAVWRVAQALLKRRGMCVRACVCIWQLALLLQSLFSLGHASMAATAAAGFHRTSLEGLALQMGVMKPHMSPHDALVASGAATHTNSGNSNTYGTNKNASNGNGNSSSSSHTAVSVGALNSPGLKTPLTESVV